ncbi:hypothetical protein [Nocardioides ochotonae]|uniref:hypothetical protein n=1 Tax=Nocardioides ochotonae TaxID=2685869 RepID=UPI00140BAAAC|nr:hypothetical protein [Nocardioides ochotonae]
MVTRRDLAEAQSFERRRVVTAFVSGFVSGSPGEHEVEPPRTGRQLLGGVVLAVLVVAGSAAAAHIDRVLDEPDRSAAASAPDVEVATCKGAPDADVEGSCWRRIGDSNP